MQISIVSFGNLRKQFFNFLKQDKPFTDFIFTDDSAKNNNKENIFAFTDYSIDCYRDNSFYVVLV